VGAVLFNFFLGLFDEVRVVCAPPEIFLAKTKMMLVRLLLAALFLASVAALQPMPMKSRMAESRRAVIAGAGAGLSAFALAGAANADAIEDIAARNALRAEADRQALAAKAEEPQDESDPKSLVLGALFGSVALSIPFYWKNVARLGIKLSGGGDGYDKVK